MRVLIVSDCYAPRLGGIETQVRDLARNLRLAGHEPAVVTATPVGDNRGRSVERVDGFPVFRTSVHLPRELPVHPRAGRELDDLMYHLRPDVVHAHVGIVSPFAWSGIAAARRAGLPLAITFHCVLGPWAPVAGVLGPVSPVRGWQRGGADLTAVSSMLAAEVRRAGAHDPVTVLPNGITIDDWRLERPGPEGRRPHRPVTVVASLRWIERKRPLQVVRAFAQAVRSTRAVTQSWRCTGTVRCATGSPGRSPTPAWPSASASWGALNAASSPGPSPTPTSICRPLPLTPSASPPSRPVARDWRWSPCAPAGSVTS
ncbi:glycosyltransferase 4-like domain protein [Actinomyces naeslundii str. Howell 279]|uniref:Glycosyltransferase 4-like domain protein n=1 Tax=Actinomyces naeslundii (strain ATCC 12104 / DSM 43013 / CCUG 2238 / JCM 8349 / NCTC 10301 / Howell 279) TaxID=1115803 RepID=J3JJI9_ACTNH|nr:glycosyltransferase 4-like domain protein [Actinomyces naeslundii str. Howell 279]